MSVGEPEEVAVIVRAQTRRRLRLAAIGAALAIGAGVAGFIGAGHVSENMNVGAVARAVAAIGMVIVLGAFTWNRIFAPPAAAELARAQAEAFQVQRCRSLLYGGVYIAVLALICAYLSTTAVHADSSWRLFLAVMFVSQCALVLGGVSGDLYPRAFRAAVDDELTAAHRASAFQYGFVMLAAAGSIAYGAALIRPSVALPSLPLAIGAGVAVCGLRFALLERAAGQEAGAGKDG